MATSISSFMSQTEAYKTPRVHHTVNELEALKKEPTKVVTSGDVYTSLAIHFKELSQEELLNEKIVVDTSKQTYVSHSNGTKNAPNRIVVIRDPQNSTNYMTLELSQTRINELKEKFHGANNFFERDDGVLRLNGEVEGFVAGWVHNINIDRNYAKSDLDGNGLVEGDEAKTLKIGFERQSDYDYIGQKIVKINFNAGENYQELGRTSPSLFADKEAKSHVQTNRTATNTHYLQFENSLDKELEHTLKMDEDLDGTISLEEGLRDDFGKDYRQNVIVDMEEFHKDLLEKNSKLNDSTKLQNYSIDTLDSVSKEEEEALLESMYHTTLEISMLELSKGAYQNETNISDSMKQLQMQAARNAYLSE
ncbi:MAG: hypothetical protein EOM38_08420 [Bacilli bacterium]|nr:hypothetical protein [Bacilli bacterium]